MPATMLTPEEKIWMGEVIARCANDKAALADLVSDPNGYLEAKYAEKFGDPSKFKGLTIVPHVNTASIMNISIPFKDFMPFNAAPPPIYNYPEHPDGYRPSDPATYVDPAANEDAAYFFRVGDYVFAQCG